MNERRRLWVWRTLVAALLLGGWEAYGRFVGSDWTSMPTDVAVQLGQWAISTLAADVGVTLLEIVVGLAIGGPLGVVMGLWLGRAPAAAALLRPLIVAMNSVPLVALTPLLILWFGIGLAPKIALVALIAFFLLFFNTFSGVRAMDEDFVAMLSLMGASRREAFQKVILPGSAVWILSGLRAALPYALIGASVGEILIARRGVGHLITASSSQFDMTGVYAALVVLMILGVLVNELSVRLETWLLRWRSRPA
ncbi:MAG: ABC transporter permease [Acidisphaera sp.]|nr:ABC transporter permease [Acidisphaera sp.]